MTSPTYDVVAIGNAIVDILAQAEDSFIEEIGVAKGSMQLIFSPEDADALYAKMGPGREISGGSAANTVAGIAALGGRTAFIGQVADDQLGQVFAHDIRAAGRKVAFTLSDVFCISRHGDDFRKLIEDGMIDILFANENELLALCEREEFEAAVQHLHGKVPVLVVTRSEKGAIALVGDERVEVPAEPIARLVDTTGAGDMFAAGFLHGQAQGRPVRDSLRLGALCAAEIIQHYGARAEVDLKELAAEKLA